MHFEWKKIFLFSLIISVLHIAFEVWAQNTFSAINNPSDRISDFFIAVPFLAAVLFIPNTNESKKN